MFFFFSKHDLISFLKICFVRQGIVATAVRSTCFWGVYYATYEWATSQFNGLTQVGFNDVGSTRQSAVVCIVV